MSFTNCCNHRFIGGNHSPIQPDGYCLNCGFHPEIEKLKEANKTLREAVGGLIHHCRDERITEESCVIAMEVDKSLDALAKADEIMGKKA